MELRDSELVTFASLDVVHSRLNYPLGTKRASLVELVASVSLGVVYSRLSYLLGTERTSLVELGYYFCKDPGKSTSHICIITPNPKRLIKLNFLIIPYKIIISTIFCFASSFFFCFFFFVLSK
jgi:hypothetical protein